MGGNTWSSVHCAQEHSHQWLSLSSRCCLALLRRSWCVSRYHKYKFTKCVNICVTCFQTDDFVAFKTKFGKQYSTIAEEKHRARIFAKNMAVASKDNEEAGEEIFGATIFSDLTPAEFKSQYLNYRRSDRHFRGNVEVEVPIAPASESVDWRTKQEGVVSAVKNQGNCGELMLLIFCLLLNNGHACLSLLNVGSCWAYSATEEIESMWVLAGNDPIDFSPQQIISCDKVYINGYHGFIIDVYARPIYHHPNCSSERSRMQWRRYPHGLQIHHESGRYGQ